MQDSALTLPGILMVDDGQERQLDWPVEGWYEPAGHCPHGIKPVFENVPGWHISVKRNII